MVRYERERKRPGAVRRGALAQDAMQVALNVGEWHCLGAGCVAGQVLWGLTWVVVVVLLLDQGDALDCLGDCEV